MYVDTHAHLYHKQFDGDRPEMVQRALDARVTHLLLPNIDGESIRAMHALVDAFPDVCRMMMGLHPCSVGQDSIASLDQVEQLLGTGQYCAVGEIGIDLYWDKTWIEEQREAFRTQVRWAKELGLPIVIHCRNSFQEVITIVEDEKDERLRGVFHCFTGSVEEGKRVLAMDGFYLGIGGVLTFPKSGLAATLAELGPDRCMLETDAPYLAPVPFRGKRNESSYIPHVAEGLAKATRRSVADIAAITTTNARDLFKL
ncbi:MAG: TatD family hydrolase [Flavobacteriales bacterium]|nr:TatD family hydrolase [Flavobacteriales bacterium]